MRLFDYECITTFWEDFSIADAFGEDAIRDTYSRAFGEWKTNYQNLRAITTIGR